MRETRGVLHLLYQLAYTARLARITSVVFCLQQGLTAMRELRFAHTVDSHTATSPPKQMQVVSSLKSLNCNSQYEEGQEQECGAACQYMCPVNCPAKCPGEHRTFVPFEFKLKYNVPIQPVSHLAYHFTIKYPINCHCDLMYTIWA